MQPPLSLPSRVLFNSPLLPINARSWCQLFMRKSTLVLFFSFCDDLSPGSSPLVHRRPPPLHPVANQDFHPIAATTTAGVWPSVRGNSPLPADFLDPSSHEVSFYGCPLATNFVISINCIVRFFFFLYWSLTDWNVVQMCEAGVDRVEALDSTAFLFHSPVKCPLQISVKA